MAAPAAAPSRRLAALALVAVAAAVVAVVAAQPWDADDGDAAGCEGVRRAHERASFIEQSGDVPTAEVYTDAGRAIRAVAVEARGDVADDLHRLADAYGQLGTLLRGFDPADPATYRVVEQRVVDIERLQGQVDGALPAVGAWLDDRC